MILSCPPVGCPRQRLLLGVVILGATFTCYMFVSIVDKWATPSENAVNPKQVSDLETETSKETAKDARTQLSPEGHTGMSEKAWEQEYETRLDRLRHVCEKDEIAMMRRVWRVAANRRRGKDTFCKTKMCPIIIDEKQLLFFCFIPKVASTKIKEFFLNISDIPVNETFTYNSTTKHKMANSALHRVSPMYFPATTARRFFKILFVRHPFDRLVSAFRSKAEQPREEIRFFYDTYWDKVMTRLRNRDKVDNTSQITFPEFIWYLIHSLERDYDEHWTPYWSRCDPCLVDYDFIGKIETAEHDFPYAFGKVGLEGTSDWWRDAMPTRRDLTLKYFSQVTVTDILNLYRIYRLDFQLFGYTLDGFLPANNTSINL